MTDEKGKICFQIKTQYISGAITDMALKRIVHENVNSLSENDAVAIYQSLAHLYLYERKYDKALMVCIMLKDKTVFQVIEKYHLFDLVIFLCDLCTQH